MKKSNRYLVTYHFADKTLQDKFYPYIKKIDEETIEVIKNAAYGVKSSRSVSDIFQELSCHISLEDELIVIELTKRLCEVHFPDFRHWLDNEHPL